jgi:hypothetical protein
VTYCSNIPFRRFVVCCVVTCCYSHSDVSSCWLRNPSPIVGNQLDHSPLSRGKIRVQITAHLTASNKSINHSLRRPEFMLTITEVASWRTSPKWWMKGEKNGLQVTVMTAASWRQPRGLQQWRILRSIQLSTLNSWNRSLYSPTNALSDTTYMTYINC